MNYRLDKLIWIALIIIFVDVTINAQKTLNIPADTMKYKITIINYYFGRVNNRITINSDSISYENKVYKGNSKIHRRLLKEDEKKKLQSFLKDFPLSKLEKQYVTNQVKDGTQMSFTISINNQLKEIFIGNVYQEDLGNLVQLIVSMLPEDFIRYKKELIYPY